MGKYLRGNIEVDMDLGTLAARTAIVQGVGDVVSESMLVSSVVARYSLSNLSALVNSGPILVGLAHSDYTAAEIEAFLEDTTGWAIGDLVAQEISSRKIRRIGVFDQEGSATNAFSLNDGKPIKVKLNWLLATGQTVDIWAYNLGTAALGTTDPNVNIQGHANLWLR